VADPKFVAINLPNPPSYIVDREYAGGFGIAQYVGIRYAAKPALNLFLPYSAAVAKELGWNYRIIDAVALKLSHQEALREVEKENPAIVLAMIGLPSFRQDVKLLNDIKEKNPDVVVVACGTICKVIPEKVLSSGKIDLIFRDDFPYIHNIESLLANARASRKFSFKEFPNISFLQDGKVVNTTDEPHEDNLDSYNPIYDDLPLDKYYQFTDLGGNKYTTVPILAGKGCSHNCSYCPYPVGFGRKYSLKSPEKIADEVEHLYNSKQVHAFIFRIQSITLNKEWAKKLFHELLKRKLDIVWACEARVDEASRELLARMKKSGCKRIHYGVETGDPQLIKIGKPNVNLMMIRKAFHLTKQNNIWTHAHMILGLPGENKQTLNTTSRFLLDLDPDSITLNFATPYPGTVLYEIAKKKNWIAVHDWAFYTSTYAVMRTDELKQKDLYHAKKKIEKEFLKQKISRLMSNPFQNHSLRLLVNYAEQLLARNLNM
jgi:radical SAM superfamily enzyme YgiQ (UPF0313 family)